MMSRVLFPNEVACVDPDECWRICQSRAGCTNIAYPKLVLGIMGTGAHAICACTCRINGHSIVKMFFGQFLAYSEHGEERFYVVCNVASTLWTGTESHSKSEPYSFPYPRNSCILTIRPKIEVHVCVWSFRNTCTGFPRNIVLQCPCLKKKRATGVCRLARSHDGSHDCGPDV